MRFELVVNGLDNAFIKEFGCDCERCSRQTRAANTSVSLLAFDGSGSLERHVLFDIGSGVTESLLQNAALTLQPRLDMIVLSHWHTDHTQEIHRLTTTWLRSRQRLGIEPTPVPVWCRSGNVPWIRHLYPNLKATQLELRPSDEFEDVGVLLKPIDLKLEGLRVTPVTTSHFTADIDASGNHQPCCAGFVLEYENFKVVFLWDLDATNLWLSNPAPHQLPTLELLHGADHVFMDCNTWAYDHNAAGQAASHVSFSMVKAFARSLKPKNTWLVHISGHEDRIGSGFGWDDTRWELEAQKAWKLDKLPGDVRVPHLGEVISLEAFNEALMSM
jgi:phosphoribosyl 1,2-cyclic phosphodiesterase